MAGEDVQRTLGMILGKLDGIERRFDDVEKDLATSERSSQDSRATMHRRLDEVIGDVGAVKVTVAGMKTDLASAKTVTDEVKRWKLMGIGALGVVGLGGAALGVSIANSLEWISKALKG